MPASTKCNGKDLPETLPVCCPKGFYIDGEEGCKLCLGRIYGTTVKQVCCGYD